MNREEWNERYAATPLLWDVDPGPFLSGEVDVLAPGRALDLGAGEGRNAVWLAQRGWHVTAVDFSDVALARGRERAEQAGAGSSIEWIDADLECFEPAAAEFDLILVLFVHLPPPARRAMLARAEAALAPGGVILVVGYDTRNAVEGNAGVRDPELVFDAADITRELPGLFVTRAERLQIGSAFDAVIRAIKTVPPL